MTFDTDFLPQLGSDAERKLALRYWDLLMDSLVSGEVTPRDEIYGAADRAGVAPQRGALIWNNVCRWLSGEAQGQRTTAP